MLHVCFVCTGNICRSPIAEKVFATELDRAGLADRVRVTSAGTGPWHAGDPADERAVEVLGRHGYPTGHVARQVNPEHLEADLLVAATDEHVAALTRVLGGREAAEKVRLLRSFDPAAPAGAELPDPYYGGDQGFDEVLAMVEAAMPGLLGWTRERVS
ncbi:low molecular weight protein-tyrosine-phosphatase [Pseudonocardia acaciae]|uniref:low molecular weight protein-tyrosine-phosphatase n=1 Tax=Pseudonocardia acaciae TaxID=551276 RepID=UPI00048E8B13